MEVHVLFMSFVMDSLRSDRCGKYFLYCLLQFIRTYGRGNIVDASVWSRRLAKAYCHYVYYEDSILHEWVGLADYAYMLPDWFWRYGAFSHANAVGIANIGTLVGAHLSSQTVYDDLETLRYYGNSGAHADRYFNIRHVGPNPDAFCSVVRISLSYVSLHLRLRARM